MSWSLASYAILALGLAAGAWWYERSQPTARVLALVATLAALAALGRVAFAAVPNVKPTTDIVLIAGFALGGAPGFMVGAVAALTSNLFFGQGPWTPWQMAAWGAVGIGGALLYRVGGEKLGGRVPLALACGFAGFAFGAVMDFQLAVTYGQGQGLLGRWAFYSGTSFGYNVAHALGNILFALAFGPALVSSLRRFRQRMTVKWVAPAPLAILAALVAGIGAVGAGAQPASAASPAAFLAHAQNRDGGFGDRPGLGSSPEFSAWAALGLAAYGHNPADVTRSGHSALAYIRSRAGSLTRTGDIERTILAGAAAGASLRHFGGRDLVKALLAHRRSNGSFDGQVNLTAFGIFSLRAAGLHASGRWLAGQADADGGFNYLGRGGSSDIDDTGAALQALAVTGYRGHRVFNRALAFLAHRQNPDGGFPANPGGSSNAQSTAWAVQGLVAARKNPSALHRPGARSPIAYLESLTAPNGSVRYSRTSMQDPVWVTGQVALALARKPFPLHRVARRPHSSAASAGGAGSSSGQSSGSTSPARARARHRAAGRGAAASARAASRIPPALRSAPGLAAWSTAAGRLAALLLAPSGPPPVAAKR
jgi:energy-coupling factor transport system substrate-specific component